MKKATKTNSLSKQVKSKTQKTTQQVKETAHRSKQKLDEARQTSAWKKTKRVAKKTTRIIGSHLATLRASITLSNEESELIEKLKNNLNKKGLYPSKSEILRAGLWGLRKLKTQELEEALQDLIRVKQTRIL